MTLKYKDLIKWLQIFNLLNLFNGVGFFSYLVELHPERASSSKPEESFYVDSYNPFKDEDAPEYLNPFDEPNHPPEAPGGVRDSPPQPAKRKNLRPVDMSKYLYADTSKAEEEELDE